MRLLLNTHALLWFVWNHANLSATARGLMTDPNNTLLLSAASAWEIAIKASLNKLSLTDPYDVFMNQATAKMRLVYVPIEVQHCVVLTSLAHHHGDPFDRMLIAQAVVEQVSIISADARFDAYPVTRLW